MDHANGLAVLHYEERGVLRELIISRAALARVSGASVLGSLVNMKSASPMGIVATDQRHVCARKHDF